MDVSLKDVCFCTKTACIFSYHYTKKKWYEIIRMTIIMYITYWSISHCMVRYTTHIYALYWIHLMAEYQHFLYLTNYK